MFSVYAFVTLGGSMGCRFLCIFPRYCLVMGAGGAAHRPLYLGHVASEQVKVTPLLDSADETTNHGKVGRI